LQMNWITHMVLNPILLETDIRVLYIKKN